MGGVIQTDPDGYRGRLPRLEVEGKDVFPGSPLAVIGLWVFALRKRFELTDAVPLPWVWTEELRPENTEDGDPLPDGSPRKLMIESAYNVEKSARNYRPAIYVNRGTVQANKIMLDNKVGVHLPSQFKAYMCHATMPVIFECESDNSGESSALGESAWAFLLSTRDIFRSDFGFHDITEPVLGDTTPTKHDKEVWSTPVQFDVTYDMRWGVTPIAPLLRDMLVKVTANVETSTFLEDLAARDGITD